MYKDGLTKQDIERAIKNSRSSKGAARYLDVSFPTFRKYAKLYTDEATGKTLYELSNNNCRGLGVKRLAKIRTRSNVSQAVFTGEMKAVGFKTKILKDRLFNEYNVEKKCEICGFDQIRMIDDNAPLIVTYKDGDHTNWTIENIRLVCYNCYFLNVGNIFSNQELQMIESGDKENNELKRKLDIPEEYFEEIVQRILDKRGDITKTKIDMSGRDLIPRKT